MFEFLHFDGYIRAKQNENFYHFGFIPIPRPTWPLIIQNLDEAIVHSTQDETRENRNVQKMRTFNNFGFILNHVTRDDVFSAFIKAISFSHQNLRENQIYTVYNFLSLSSVSETLGRHNDVMDVWCWQILGKTHMIVEGKQMTFDKVLEPGELIYIPRGMYHATKPLGPRSLISFGAEDKR